MKIILDAMGGDHAPDAVVQGALEARKQWNIDIVLVGRTEDILRCVAESAEKTLPSGIEIRDAPEVVEISDDPATVFRTKKKSSMVIGLEMVRDGLGDAFISAGSTGALLAGATLVVKRIRGIRRAVVAPKVPCLNGRFLLCDSGANAECTPEYLLQFAYLGSFYAKQIMNIAKPRVALLNIGAEAEKGDSLRRETYTLLKAAGDANRICFTGNIESNDAMMGGADVVVADGFSGNVMLKAIEGSAIFMSKVLKEMFLTSGKTKLAAVLMKEQMKQFKSMLDPSEVGGSAFLGISKPVLKAHGGSDAHAIANAVRQAQEFVESGFIQAVEKNISYMRLDKNG